MFQLLHNVLVEVFYIIIYISVLGRNVINRRNAKIV